MHNLNDDALNLLFRDARTYSAWLNRPVEMTLCGNCMTSPGGALPARTPVLLVSCLFAHRRRRSDSGRHCRRETSKKR
jgi:hypothetical protein